MFSDLDGTRRALSEASLHLLEFVDAVDTLWFGFAEDETREGGLEVIAAGAVGHAT